MLVIKPICCKRLELYRMLDEAESDVAAGDRGVSVAAIRRQLKRQPGTRRRSNARVSQRSGA
jgi:hypothetical protein